MPDLDRRRQRITALLREPHRDWYRIDNKAGDVATVHLYDEIGYWGVTAADFVRDLKDVTARTIELHVNSPGGDVFEGIAILNALRQHPARVVAIVDGLAASAASFIAAGADEVVMARNSELMVHEASGLAIGPAALMRDMADDLDRVSDNIASIYADKAGGTVTDWRKVMQAETWYSADEAVTAGLADRVDDGADGSKPKAKVDRSLFNYAGRDAAPAPAVVPARARTDASPPEKEHPVVAFTDEQIQTMRERLGVGADVDEAGILAALDEALEEVADPPPVDEDNLPPAVVAQLAELGALRASAATAQRDADLDRAQRENRITPGERAGWAARYDTAPDATRALLASLPTGRVPLEPIGHDGDNEGQSPDDQMYAALFPGTVR